MRIVISHLVFKSFFLLTFTFLVGIAYSVMRFQIFAVEGIDSVNHSELNHSEVYDPYVVLNALDTVNLLMAEFNQHGLSPKDLIKIILLNRLSAG